ESVNQEDFQDQLSQVFWQQLMPALGKICDEYSPANRLHAVERLTLDLGKISIKQLPLVLKEKFMPLFEEELKSRIQEIRDIERTSSFTNQGGAKSILSERDISTAAGNPRGLDEVRSIAESHHTSREIIQYFLRTGMLPWWVKSDQPTAILDTVESLLDIPKESTWLISFFQEAVAAQRLINELSDELLVKLWELESGEIFPPEKEVPTNKTGRSAFWKAYFLPSADRTPATKSRSEIAKDGQKTPSDTPLSRKNKEEPHTDSFQLEENQSSKDRSSREAEEKESRKLSSEEKLKAENSNSTSEKRAVDSHKETDKGIEGSRQEQLHSSGKKKPFSISEENKLRELNSAKDKQTDAESPIFSKKETLYTTRPPSFANTEEIYVENAGLVLLWPFFERFFSIHDLLEGKFFVSIAAQHKAAFLLQALVTGLPQAPEYQLPLNKVLCGIPLYAPLETVDELGESELASCEELLEAMMAQVPILSGTSVNGLRGSFLWREGVMKAHNDHWKLNVERQTHDIVLSRLPWPFNFIRFPWMDHMVYVEW
ncbi:MAG: contractile injection system tape measure protein, partial [Bacteroidota bacterium]